MYMNMELGWCYFRTGSLWEWYSALAVTDTVHNYTCINCSVESVTLVAGMKRRSQLLLVLLGWGNQMTRCQIRGFVCM
jgi:hypothetical protein